MNQIPNGFRPCISADGLRIAAGFNAVLDIDAKTGHVTTIDTHGEAAWAGWHNGVIAYGQYRPEGRVLVNGPMQPPPSQLPGVNPARAVVNGIVVSSANGQHFINGQPVRYDAQQSNIEDFDGTHFGYKPFNGGQPFMVRNVHTQEVAVQLGEQATECSVFTAPDGTPWVFGNFTGRATIYNRAGVVYWQFPAGEFAGCLSLGPHGDIYAWTVGQNADGSPFVKGRPFSNLAGEPVVTIQMWWAGFQAVWREHDQRWTAAGYYNGTGGTLYIDADVKLTGTPPVIPPVTPPSSGDYVVNVPAGTMRLIVNLP